MQPATSISALSHFTAATTLLDFANHCSLLDEQELLLLINSMAARAGGVQEDVWYRWLRLARALNVPWVKRLKEYQSKRVPCPDSWCGRFVAYQTWREKIISWYELSSTAPLDLTAPNSAPPVWKEPLVVITNNVYACVQFNGSILMVFVDTYDNNQVRISAIRDISLAGEISISLDTNRGEYKDENREIPDIGVVFSLPGRAEVQWGNRYVEDKNPIVFAPAADPVVSALLS